MSHTVLQEIHDKVALRPIKLNALNYGLIDRLKELPDEIKRDDAVRVVVLTGAREREFSWGADIAGETRRWLVSLPPTGEPFPQASYWIARRAVFMK
jgi:enoyl-CoA hydratase/carnithine racemase